MRGLELRGVAHWSKALHPDPERRLRYQTPEGAEELFALLSDRGCELVPALTNRVGEAIRSEGVGATLDPDLVVAEAIECLGEDRGIALLSRPRGLGILMTRLALWHRLQDDDAPDLRREELASQLSSAAGEVGRQRDALLEGCWLDAPNLHRWLYARIGSCLGISWAPREPERWFDDEGNEVPGPPPSYFGEDPDELFPPRRRAERSPEFSNALLDEARRMLADMSLELLGRLSEDVAGSVDRISFHVNDLLVGSRAKNRDPWIFRFCSDEEGQRNRSEGLPLLGRVSIPGPRALFAVAGHCHIELATATYDGRARLRANELVRDSLSLFHVFGRTGESNLIALIDECVRGVRRSDRLVDGFIALLVPLWKLAKRDRASPPKQATASRTVVGRHGDVDVPAAASHEPYDVPLGTRWHQIVIELTYDPEELGVRLGNRRLPPLTPASLGMLDGRRKRSRPTPAWATFVAYLSSRFERGMRQAPDPRDRVKFRKRIGRIRAALKASFPGIAASEDPLRFTPGEGWEPGFTPDDARERL